MHLEFGIDSKLAFCLHHTSFTKCCFSTASISGLRPESKPDFVMSVPVRSPTCSHGLIDSDPLFDLSIPASTEGLQPTGLDSELP